jgi:dCMP deaminase
VRPGWDEYFLDLAALTGSRATCDRGRSGCVITLEKRILATGYVGSPPGLPHCDEAGHLMRQVIDEDGESRLHCVRTIHAEQNAILQAAKTGTRLDGGTLYCSMEPCRTCAMLIITVGIRRVVTQRRYHAGRDTRQMFQAAGVELHVVSDEVLAYEGQLAPGPVEP